GEPEEPRIGIESEIAAGHDRFGAVVGATQLCADARLQFLDLEGLGEVVVSARIEAAHAPVEAGIGGEHDHRHRISATAQVLQHVEPTASRKRKIEDDQRMLAESKRMLGILAVMDDVYGI